MKFYKYTPALLDPKTLEDTLIGRDIELDNLKRILKSASSGKSFSHAILVGPKGIGKTHVLRILYHAVKGDIKTKGLNIYKDNFIPVIFSEEEYPGNITKFIKLTLHYLSESESGSFPPIPEELMKAVTLTIKERELAFDYIKIFKKKTGKILLLLVDNLNDIIERFTDEDQSSLREILMTYDSILLAGSAPTLFDSIINHDRPFYNFFEIIWLKDLSFEETITLLNRYATLENKPDLIEKFKVSEPKLRAIHELAGGNPRLILSLFHIIAEGDIASVENTFLKLLDEMTSFFRERIKDLSEQQKEIIDVMARAEGLLTPTEIAARCYMPVNVVLSQIKRLEKIGYIKVAKKYAKKVFYDFNERLFSLWRQMRVEAGRKRLGFVVKFLELWFTKEELFKYLDKTLNRIREKLSLDSAEVKFDIDELWYIKEAISEFKGDDEICVACKRKDYNVALGMINKALKIKPDDVGMLLLQGCIFYSQLTRYDEALQIYKKVIEIKPDEYRAWLNLGNIYACHLKRYDEALQAYKKTIEIKPDEYKTWNNMGNTYNELKRYDEAIETYKKAIEIKPDTYNSWHNIGNTYGKLKRYDEAIEAFKKAIELKPDNGSWNNLGIIYGKLKRYDEAVEVFKKAIELKPDCFEAWANLGHAYYHIRTYKEAIKAYKEAMRIKPGDDLLVEFFGMLIGIFVNEGIEGNTNLSIKNLREALTYFIKLNDKKKSADIFISAFKDIIKAKTIELLKTALDEIRARNLPELMEFLSPCFTFVKYLETKDPEIIDRLRHEERIVVDDMIKMLENNAEEKPKKSDRKTKLKK